jgi:hypothetical protein
MLITGIKSKPVYEPLRADVGGRYHLMLASGPGGEALLRVLGEIRDAAPQALQNTRACSYPMPTPRRVPRAFAYRRGRRRASRNSASPTCACSTDVRRCSPPSEPSSTESLMGTRLYVAGPESFIGLAMKLALEFNINKDEIRAEECAPPRAACTACTAAPPPRTSRPIS